MFTCPLCDGFCIEDWKSFLHHQQQHGSLNSSSSLRTFCGYDGCSRFFTGEDKLRRHLKHVHGYSIIDGNSINKGHIGPNENGRFICELRLCRKEFENYDKFLKHLKAHITDGNPMNCPAANCPKIYSKVQSLTGHISKHHRMGGRRFIDVDSSVTADNILIESDTETFDPILMEFSELNNVNVNCIAADHNNLNDLFVQNLANLYLRLESEYMIPVSTLKFLVTQLNSIDNTRQDVVKNCWKQILGR